MDLGANEWTTFRKVTLPLIAPAILAGPLLGFRALGRRLRDHVLQLGGGDHVPALRLGRRARRRAAAGQRDRDRDLRRRARLMLVNILIQSRRAKGTRMSTPETGLDPASSCSRPRATTSGSTSRAWAGTPRTAELPIIVRGDGCYLEDVERQALPRRARRAVRRPDRLLVRRGDRRGRRGADARAALLHELVATRIRARSSWPPRSRRSRPGDLNRVFFVLGRLRGGRVGVEARAPVPRGARRAALEGDLAQRRLPRHDDGRALDQRHPGAARAVRAARPRRDPRPEHEPLPPAGGRRPRRSSPRSCSTTSRRRSTQAGPGDGRDGDHGAGAERGRRVHAAGRLLRRACARSATATGSCSAPTR